MIETDLFLEESARNGYRTLLIAMRLLDKQEVS